LRQLGPQRRRELGVLRAVDEDLERCRRLVGVYSRSDVAAAHPEDGPDDEQSQRARRHADEPRMMLHFKRFR